MHCHTVVFLFPGGVAEQDLFTLGDSKIAREKHTSVCVLSSRHSRLATALLVSGFQRAAHPPPRPQSASDTPASGHSPYEPHSLPVHHSANAVRPPPSTALVGTQARVRGGRTLYAASTMSSHLW
eukprot:1906438-Rhodomonas_salina.2